MEQLISEARSLAARADEAGEALIRRVLQPCHTVLAGSPSPCTCQSVDVAARLEQAGPWPHRRSRRSMRVKSGATAVGKVHIEASAEVIYDLVADVTRMGEWSPECTGAEWLNGAAGPSVGAEFRGKNSHGRLRWATSPRVVAAERGREFSFVVPGLFGHDAARWTYQFDPAGSGTEVREVCELLRDPPFFSGWVYRWAMGVKDRKADLEANIRKTLDALKAEAERTPAPELPT